MEKALRYIEQHRDRFVSELQEFVRIPSISALPEHKGDVRRAGEWVAQRLREAGFPKVEMLETSGHPAVFAEWQAASGKPTVVIYGHFDVQPVDPLNEWTGDPFGGELKDGRIWGRGATDDKGCIYAPIKAVEALVKGEGRLPVNVKFLIEGEEEVGSPHLGEVLGGPGGPLSADLAIGADGDMYGPTQPSLVLGSRGLCGLQIDVQGPARDLHSGQYGGAVPNPIHGLASILASLHRPDGAVAVEGFYDRVRPLSAEEKGRLAAIPFDEQVQLKDLDIPGFIGEPGYSPRERMTVRPTLEVNGVGGGFQGEGIKTVLPARAMAKITCRLVADQEPVEILEQLEAHIRKHAPQGFKVTLTRLPGMARPYRMPADHPAMRLAHRLLAEEYGKEPYYLWMGGTVPVSEMFRSRLNTWFLYYSFGDPDANIHSPNEFYRVSSYERGIRAYCRLLEALAEVRPEELRG